MLARVRLGDIAMHQLTQSIGPERAASTRQKESTAIRWPHETGPSPTQIFIDPGERSGSNGHHAIFLPFALPDKEHATPDIEVRNHEAQQFQPPNAGRIEHFEHRAVAESERVGD